MSSNQDNQDFRDRISTVDEAGKRKWMYPKKPKGKFYTYRNIVTVILLALFFILPFVKVNGNPILIFNILDRQFIIFGLAFTPQDLHIFAIGTVLLLIFIILFTFVFGRLFCGWICPQTIFMEMLFRKVEYWIEGDRRSQIKLNNSAWDGSKIFKKTLKHLIFIALSVLIINFLISYVIGMDALLEWIKSPLANGRGLFIAMIVLSAMFYFIFAFFREQVCTNICPYGRMQGVLLVDDSIVVQYDFVRGEGRGTVKDRKESGVVPQNIVDSFSEDVIAGKKNRNVTVNDWGDCIDCDQCVDVCPTGIDIRNGTQLECINCTACIDACNEVMTKLDKPKGLIRYDSYKGVLTGRDRLITKRGWAYSAILMVFLILFSIVLFNRNSVESIILRVPGMTFQELENDTIQNLYQFKLINKTTTRIENIDFKIMNVEEAKVQYVGSIQDIEELKRTEGQFFIKIPRSILEAKKTELEIGVFSNGELIEDNKTNFLGPMNLNKGD